MKIQIKSVEVDNSGARAEPPVKLVEGFLVMRVSCRRWIRVTVVSDCDAKIFASLRSNQGADPSSSVDAVAKARSRTEITIEPTLVPFDGELWLEAGTPENGWFQDIQKNPAVNFKANGRVSRYIAQPVDGASAHSRVRSLIRAKYGLRDLWVGLIIDTSRSVSVHLVPGTSIQGQRNRGLPDETPAGNECLGELAVPVPDPEHDRPSGHGDGRDGHLHAARRTESVVSHRTVGIGLDELLQPLAQTGPVRIQPLGRATGLASLEQRGADLLVVLTLAVAANQLACGDRDADQRDHRDPDQDAAAAARAAGHAEASP